MNSAMTLIVAAYVKTGQLAALQDLRTHRQHLASTIRDRADFEFGVLLDQLEDDIREIDAGIRRLRVPAEPSVTAEP